MAARGPSAGGEAKPRIRGARRLALGVACRDAEGTVAARFASREAGEGMAGGLGTRRAKWTE